MTLSFGFIEKFFGRSTVLARNRFVLRLVRNPKTVSSEPLTIIVLVGQNGFTALGSVGRKRRKNNRFRTFRTSTGFSSSAEEALLKRRSGAGGNGGTGAGRPGRILAGAFPVRATLARRSDKFGPRNGGTTTTTAATKKKTRGRRSSANLAKRELVCASAESRRGNGALVHGVARFVGSVRRYVWWGQREPRLCGGAERTDRRTTARYRGMAAWRRSKLPRNPLNCSLCMDNSRWDGVGGGGGEARGAECKKFRFSQNTPCGHSLLARTQTPGSRPSPVRRRRRRLSAAVNLRRFDVVSSGIEGVRGLRVGTGSSVRSCSIAETAFRTFPSARRTVFGTETPRPALCKNNK